MSEITKTKVHEALEHIHVMCKDQFCDLMLEMVFQIYGAPYPFLAHRVLVRMGMIEFKPGDKKKYAYKWIGYPPNAQMATFLFSKLSDIANGRNTIFRDTSLIPEKPELDHIPNVGNMVNPDTGLYIPKKRGRPIKTGEIVTTKTIEKVIEENNTEPRKSSILAKREPIQDGNSFKNEKYPLTEEECIHPEKILKYFDTPMLIAELKKRGCSGTLYLTKDIITL